MTQRHEHAKVGLAIALVGTFALVGCSSSSSAKPSVVRITDPHVAKSVVASQFVEDLYTAPHGDYWRTLQQDRLVEDAGIGCLTPKTMRSDTAVEFRGLSSSGVDEFVAIAKRDICAKMTHDSQIPGYFTHD